MPSTCSLSYDDSSYRVRNRCPSSTATCSPCSSRSLTRNRQSGTHLRTFLSCFLVRCSANPCGLVANVYEPKTGYCCIDIGPAFTDSRCTCPNNVQSFNTPCRRDDLRLPLVPILAVSRCDCSQSSCLQSRVRQRWSVQYSQRSECMLVHTGLCWWQLRTARFVDTFVVSFVIE